MNEEVKKIIEDVKALSTQELIGYILRRFGDKAALASSFSTEDQVVTDMMWRVSTDVKIFTLDTGRLPEQTYEVIERTGKKYGIKISIMFPDSGQVEQMVKEKGPNLFYDSIENRKLCCRIRKIEPLKRALSNLDAWLCGLRAEQSVTRAQLKTVECDDTFNLIKVCPLADWTTQQVWEYIKENDVPYNRLHDEGYPSIGCTPCTRAVKDGEDIRAGRWWWEEPEHKECGLHLKADDSNAGEEK